MIRSNPEKEKKMGLSAVGVDLGGTKIAAALVNEQGRILKSARLSTDVEGGASAVVAQITELVRKLTGIAGSSVVGIGVGVAGQIETEGGAVRFAPNLDWHDVPLQSQLSTACNLPVVITNEDAGVIGAAALALQCLKHKNKGEKQ